MSLARTLLLVGALPLAPLRAQSIITPDSTVRTVASFAAADGARQKDVARKYNVSPSVVSESLKAAQFDPYRRAEQAFADALERFA